MLKFVNKLFGSSNKNKIKSYSKLINDINNFEEKLSQLSDDDLKNKTSYFKNLLNEGSTIDNILPEAFSVVREVSKRTIGLRHFDVQLIG